MQKTPQNVDSWFQGGPLVKKKKQGGDWERRSKPGGFALERKRRKRRRTRKMGKSKIPMMVTPEDIVGRAQKTRTTSKVE